MSFSCNTTLTSTAMATTTTRTTTTDLRIVQNVGDHDADGGAGSDSIHVHKSNALTETTKEVDCLLCLFSANKAVFATKLTNASKCRMKEIRLMFSLTFVSGARISR